MTAGKPRTEPKPIAKPFQLMGLLALGLLAASPGNAEPTKIYAYPKTFPNGVQVRPYSLTNSNLFGVNVQQLCVLLENTSLSGTISGVEVHSQMEEPGTGVPGPWPLLPLFTSQVSVPGGVPVTCTESGNVGRTAPILSFAAGEVTDACCFLLSESGDLPEAGDMTRHTDASGAVVEIPLQANSISPVGGTTCGLVGLEFLGLAPLLRLVRRKLAS